MNAWRRLAEWVACRSRRVQVDLDAMEAHLHRMDQQIGLVSADPLMGGLLDSLTALAASSALSDRKQRELKRMITRVRADWRELETRAHALRISLHEERRSLLPGSFWARALGPGERETHTYLRRLPDEAPDRPAVVGERGGSAMQSDCQGKPGILPPSRATRVPPHRRALGALQEAES